jgi:integrase
MNGKVVPTTKTNKARVVGVPGFLAARLTDYRARLVAEQHPGLSSGLMFPSRAGKPLASSRISDALRAACKAAGIKERFTSHGFRRSMTDLLREAEVDPVVATTIIGHDTSRMRRHYSNVADREAVADVNLYPDRIGIDPDDPR